MQSLLLNRLGLTIRADQHQPRWIRQRSLRPRNYYRDRLAGSWDSAGVHTGSELRSQDHRYPVTSHGQEDTASTLRSIDTFNFQDKPSCAVASHVVGGDLGNS